MIAAGVIEGRVDRSWAFDEARPQEHLGCDQHLEWEENCPSSALLLAMPPFDLLLCLEPLPRVPVKPRGISTICTFLLAPLKASTYGSQIYLSLASSKHLWILLFSSSVFLPSSLALRNALTALAHSFW